MHDYLDQSIDSEDTTYIELYGKYNILFAKTENGKTVV